MYRDEYNLKKKQKAPRKTAVRGAVSVNLSYNVFRARKPDRFTQPTLLILKPFSGTGFDKQLCKGLDIDIFVGILEITRPYGLQQSVNYTDSSTVYQ